MLRWPACPDSSKIPSSDRNDNDNDNDNDTLREVRPTIVRGPGFTGMSEGAMTPRKKESVRADGLALLARLALAHC